MKLSPATFTHAGAAIFGLLLAFALLHRQQAFSSATDQETAGGPSVPARPGKDGTTQGKDAAAQAQATKIQRYTPPKFRASEYKKAWDAIADQSLPTHQRHILQMELLTQWAEVDLESALTAAFETSWDSDNGLGIQSLLGAFSKEFAKRPTESWDIITSGKLGLGAALAKGRWASEVIKENPFLVMANLRQIPLQSRREIFPQLLAAVQKDPSKIGALYDKLAEMPQDQSFRDLAKQSVEVLGARGTTEQIREQFTASTSEAQRTLLVHEFGKSLANADFSTIQAEIGKLPEEDRGRMLRSITTHAERGGTDTPQLIEALINARQYNDVVWQANEHIEAYAKTPENQQKLAAWVTTLPKITGSTQVIHRSLAGYLARDPQGGRAWIESIPADNWTRNVALAEYSQQVLWKYNNPEESQWALSQITDPHTKQEAVKWRANWERRR